MKTIALIFYSWKSNNIKMKTRQKEEKKSNFLKTLEKFRHEIFQKKGATRQKINLRENHKILRQNSLKVTEAILNLHRPKLLLKSAYPIKISNNISLKIQISKFQAYNQRDVESIPFPADTSAIRS